MEDVSFPVSNLLFLASIAVDHFAMRSRKVKLASFLISLVACAVLFTHIHLPVSSDAVDAFWLVIAVGWVIVLVVAVPKVLRATKAHARE